MAFITSMFETSKHLISSDAPDKGVDRSTWFFYLIQTYIFASRGLEYQTWADKYLQLLEQNFHEVSRDILFEQIDNACRHLVLLDSEYAGICWN